MRENMSKDWNGYKQGEKIPVGTKEKTKIARMSEGTQADFRNDKYWEAVQKKEKLTDEELAEVKAQGAIEIETDNGAVMVLTLPKEKVVPAKSNLALFQNTYGDFPNEGMEVTTKIDENGFWRIVLEK
jgi:hypothetical protein